ncbi:uncharacterized protein LOC123218854 [Mangifera indica]|uniref:uncharacterized protein LOC123218854 n=1 Tax=Mangifera indica TaxID=29780 RepID=UPI001CFBAB3B|nr:uncharacterized protein LOC123218854 [Mangifera indica]
MHVTKRLKPILVISLAKQAHYITLTTPTRRLAEVNNFIEVQNRLKKMATQQLIAENKEGAEIHHGADICKQKCHELLVELNLPKGLLPLNDIAEMGYNSSTGFLWLKQSKRYEHKFQGIGRTVAYETELTAFAENRRMRKVSGVKSQQLLMWVKIAEMSIEEPGKVKFTSVAGLSMSFPVSAFELEEKDHK